MIDMIVIVLKVVDIEVFFVSKINLIEIIDSKIDKFYLYLFDLDQDNVIMDSLSLQ